MTQSPYKGKTGISRIIKAFGYSAQGCISAWKYEDAFRMEVAVAMIAIPLALWLPVGNIRKALLVSSILLVMIVELVNSAIEATVDRISLDNHELAKRAKDIGSFAVLMSLINAAVIWVLVIWG